MAEMATVPDARKIHLMQYKQNSSSDNNNKKILQQKKNTHAHMCMSQMLKETNLFAYIRQMCVFTRTLKMMPDTIETQHRTK